MNCHRVQTQLMGHGVDVAVERKQHLRATKTTESPMRRIVRVNQLRITPHMLEAVHVVTAHGADVHDLGTQPAVGAAIGHNLDILGHNAPLPVHAHAQGDALWQAAAGGQKIFQAIVHQPNRRSDFQRQQCGHQGVGIFHNLAAKAPTDGRGHHADAGDGHFQSTSQPGPGQKDRLGRCPDLQPLVRIQPCDRAHGLHVTWVLRMGGVGLFMHAMGCGESRIDIAPMKSNLVRDVVSTIVQRRRLGIQGLLRTQNRHIFFVNHPNQIQCVAGDFFAHGCNGGHFLSGKSHPTFGQNMPVFVGNAPTRRWGILTSQNGLDAGQSQCSRDINRHNARTGIGTAQHLAKQHAWQLDVAGIRSAAQYLGSGIDLRRIPAQCRLTHDFSLRGRELFLLNLR